MAFLLKLFPHPGCLQLRAALLWHGTVQVWFLVSGKDRKDPRVIYWVVRPGRGVGLLTTKLHTFPAASLLRMNFPEPYILGGPSYLPLTMSQKCEGEGAGGSHTSISLLQACWTCSCQTHCAWLHGAGVVITLRQQLRERLSEVQWQQYFQKCLQNLSEPCTSSYLLPQQTLHCTVAAFPALQQHIAVLHSSTYT